MSQGSELERLSGLDRAFLTIESGTLHMHVGAVGIFEGGGLVAPDGGLDAAALRRLIDARLENIPRFRQRVRSVPLLGAVWVADPHFRIDYHVRHTALPRPGTRAQLDQLAGRIFSQPLDRERPLWEMWLIEGLEGGRFAMLIKAHHAMLDGIAGMGVLVALLSLEPTEIPTEFRRVDTLEEPAREELAESLVAQRKHRIRALAAHAAALSGSAERARLRGALGGVWGLMMGIARTAATATALNPRAIGPHRAFTGVRLPLEPLREVRRVWGGTLNDVALGVVAGALRRHLTRRGEPPAPGALLRALVPVNLRAKGAAPGAGNKVAMLVASLPVGERDPRARHDAIERSTRALKTSSHEVDAAQLVEELGDAGPAGLVGAVFGAALHMLPFHVVVTNVPGPPVPLYLGSARLEELLPLVPLFERQSVGIAVATYSGSFFVGLNGDAGAVPDLDLLAADVQAAAAEIVTAALGAGAPGPTSSSLR